MPTSGDRVDALARDQVTTRFEWAPSSGWTVEPGAGSLTASAGADHVFVLDELPDPAVAEITALWLGAATAGELSAAGREALDQLVLLGALRPVPHVGPDPAGALTVAVAFAGVTPPALHRALLDAVAGTDGVAAALANEAALVILVRTSATLADAAEAAGRRPVPHLFVDTAYHHTVSLGPFVVPGQTACLSCLAGRVAGPWSDPPPPPEPEAAGAAQLVAGLVAVELRRIVAGACELANRTVSVDVERWRLVDETLLRLPWCTACGVRRAPAGTPVTTAP